MARVIIEFPNTLAAEHFAHWLSIHGEESYWTCMEELIQDHKGEEPIMVRTFNHTYKANKNGDVIIGTRMHQ